MPDEITAFGFTYGPATVTRLSVVPGRGRTLEISTDHARLQVYISEAGHKIETYELPSYKPSESAGAE